MANVKLGASPVSGGLGWREPNRLFWFFKKMSRTTAFPNNSWGKINITMHFQSFECTLSDFLQSGNKFQQVTFVKTV
jgi:hypothetical protein